MTAPSQLWRIECCHVISGRRGLCCNPVTKVGRDADRAVQMFYEAWVEGSGGNLVRLPELSARLAGGEKGPVSDWAHL